MTPPKLGKVQLWIEDGDGRMVPLTPVPTPRRAFIRCLPIPGPDGVLYVPEWYGLTEFG